jgi:diadenosine tetraphosphate (Ap4A) HIT family hydrolase
MTCPLCEGPGGELVWRDDFCRVILVDDKDYPGFCRVILNRHIAEMTDLTSQERTRLMNVVFTVEQGLRQVMSPDKINLASLGNQVPHVHWHVIPRFRDDRRFPNAIWAPAAAGATGVVHPVNGERLTGVIYDLLNQMGRSS